MKLSFQGSEHCRLALPCCLILALGLAPASAGRFRSHGADGPSSLAAPSLASPPALRAASQNASTIRLAEDELMHFLVAPLPPYEDFLPACVSHVKKLVRSIDSAYTDEQLLHILESECTRDKQFVTVQTGFAHEEACRSFAKELAAARTKELGGNSSGAYDEFCKGYYVHKGGTPTEIKPTPNVTETEPNTTETKPKSFVPTAIETESNTTEATNATNETSVKSEGARSTSVGLAVALILSGSLARPWK